ncbi:hypothetical protein [uncultured Deinococcus sp.]|uniref:hypothetical protein n=1 Tax=uncultured Deinococcus sp. TaxID=158789 RepID=UPI0025EE7012|nr:hypothetical protein [uncultured Deinococcus sp.]
MSGLLLPPLPKARKKAVNGNAKGKEGERELARVLTELGYPASRGQQFKGGTDSPDVVCPSLPGVHWEVKRYATCQLFSPAMVASWDAQAAQDCGTRHPVIAHRWNGARQWWVRVPSAERGAYWQPLEVALPYLRSL